MLEHQKYFNGKKVTLMGLGLLGRGLGDAIFLAQNGAQLIVTDIRDEKMLASSLAKLKRYKDIRYTLGGHTFEDFRNRDFILKAAGVPLDSPYIAEAKKNGIPIEMDASLFAKLMPKGVTLVGVTGTRGKSTTAECIFTILKAAKKRVFLGGVVHTATLPLLTKVRAGDIVVLELDSWQLQGFHDAKISPHIAVFTTFMDDHLLYYKGDRKRYFDDKTAIFRYQKRNGVLVVGKQAQQQVRSARPPGRIVVAAANLLKSWELQVLGDHNRENIACAVAVAKALGIAYAIIKRGVEAFRGVPGRLEYLRTIRGVKIYNDNNATTPDATIAALHALNPKSEIRNPKQILNSKSLNAKRLTLNTERNIVLIMGGTDKGLDMSKLVAEIPKYCKGLVLLKESGTTKFLTLIHNSKFIIQEMVEAENLKECVEKAMNMAQSGDTVLFSPAFASFGKWFKNEYDRGEQFVEIVKKSK
ncbi:MAG TPA: UDP-N-acetylmuramoyl-L-alanine--D-glutamate ligase [Candidatus Taylorbacteria bacterium]|nr:MAG: UDP-N-acetylmuramoylalanine-D-glutamate ligase [Parcubacteria group bacterium GW2011_GWA2_47_64]KKU96014.1 MAG: UDP-N-acetylmuramoylalanine-D-glutamate ligase [Parcubacteria group bacterium GW2011_GWC2_48_17]HBV01472.1 UDP-N-acetylmuramoyl-L-alanine--D-glutamate ligase [Candidatus Taylorbacteria bacterium]